MLNFYLLFHKCGNNYANNVHELYNGTKYVESLEPGEEVSFAEYEESQDIVNVRCRNFGLQNIERHNFLADNNARFLVFTRNPASFVVSAAKYHTRGEEEWARTRPLQTLGGQTLHAALNNASSDSEKYIITMKHFKFLYEKQASLSKLFSDQRCMQIKTEELFVNKDPDYYRAIAKFLRLGDSSDYINALMQASPAFKRDLPKHSTGTFRNQDILSTFDNEAKDYFEKHFSKYGEYLGYL